MVYKGLLITLRLIILHSLPAVADSGSRRVCDYAKNGKHREQRVYNGQQLVSKRVKLEIDAEHRRNYLNKQQHCRNEREPKVLFLSLTVQLIFIINPPDDVPVY